MKFLKIVWIAAATFSLFFTLYAFDGKPNSDIGPLFAWSMVALSFPAGLLVQLVHIALYDWFSIAVKTSYFSLLIDGASFLLMGYLQWFVLLPWLWRKWKAR